MRVIRTVVADDDAAFRAAVVDVLEADPRFRVTEAVASGEDIGGIVVRARADVVLLDVRMREGGAVAAHAIHAAAAANGLRVPAVVAVSAQAAPHVVVEMLREGAVGYLVKGRLGSDLPDLLVRCASGEVVLAVPTAAEALRQLFEVKV